MKITLKQTKSLEAIMKLDLGRVIERTVADNRPALGTWTKDRLAELERDYRRWLVLKILYPDARAIPPVGRPSWAVDRVWHAHITDTHKYQADCQTVFGEYLHHDPTPVGREAARAAWQLYCQTFATSIWGMPPGEIGTLMFEATETPDASDSSDFEDCA